MKLRRHIVPFWGLGGSKSKENNGSCPNQNVQYSYVAQDSTVLEPLSTYSNHGDGCRGTRRWVSNIRGQIKASVSLENLSWRCSIVPFLCFLFIYLIYCIIYKPVPDGYPQIDISGITLQLLLGSIKCRQGYLDSVSLCQNISFQNRLNDLMKPSLLPHETKLIDCRYDFTSRCSITVVLYWRRVPLRRP